MPERTFELREIAWTPPRIASAGLMLAIGSLYLALATTTGQLQFAVLGLGLLGCFVVYFTDYWLPEFHLVVAAYAILIAGIEFATGPSSMSVTYANATLTALLVTMLLYLLVSERRNVDAETVDG